MGKRFKLVLGLAGCLVVLYSAIGPILVLTFDGERRLFILALWASMFGLLILAFICATIFRSERRALQLLSNIRREVASKNNKDVIAEVKDARLKQSRHEYKHEMLLNRIDMSSATIIGDVDSLRSAEVVPTLAQIPWHGKHDNGAKVLFITSNGSGMGHLSRCLAVANQAEKVGFQSAILTLSTAYQVVRDSGYPVMYHPSSAVSPWSISVWNRSFARFLQERVENDRPDVVVFDGTAVYRGVTQLCRRLEIPLVWLRRGMWKDGVSRAQYDHPLEVADFVIVPGEVTGEAPREQSNVNYVGPVSQASQLDIFEPADAKRALGLDPDRRYVLIQVGTAQIAGQSAVQLALDQLGTLDNGLTPAVLVSPVAKQVPIVPNGVVVHGRYPLVPYLKAFDFAVSSAGYNSVHENLAVNVPAAYVPNTATVTDDQTARVDLIERSGMGLAARDEVELQGALQRLTDEQHRAAIVAQLAEKASCDGAPAIVEALTEIVDMTRIDQLHPGGAPSTN